ncbi:hypothetical protein BDD43_2919 [Mucilaginibacter gracilis]|uniref:YdhG-like domain-containing protein n=1 Tax=Mucilaginibacter gracilis TaxID=423350 RepID=A0A495J310_9SPHI|nr:DUF1801 domain-containing protein [Mucilaginibacter gracilis]RKR82734.1 hypothetical protein BDD43_2919 [Mucilaginibacter gracilis]
MTIADHLNQQETARIPLMSELHRVILKNDTTVIATVGSMMGKQMILYTDRGSFKYGLAGSKDHITLHVLPIYGNALLHARYVELLPNAKLQKGCINFKNEAQMPLEIAAQLIADCAGIDMIAIRQNYLDKKKK